MLTSGDHWSITRGDFIVYTHGELIQPARTIEQPEGEGLLYVGVVVDLAERSLAATLIPTIPLSWRYLLSGVTTQVSH